MGVILDTSILISAERQGLEIDEYIKDREEDFGLSVITVSELLHGVHRADSNGRQLKRSAFVEKVIELFPVFYFDIPVARVYAKLWSDLNKKGIQLGAHDLIIGATAISLGFSVATFNIRHFKSIEGLKIEMLSIK